MTKKIVALAGDGIGPEIMEAGLSVLKAVAEKTNFDYSVHLVERGLMRLVILYQLLL